MSREAEKQSVFPISSEHSKGVARWHLSGVWQRFATKWAIAALKPEMTAFRESRPCSRSEIPAIIESQGIAIADARQSRIDFAFSVNVARSDRVSEWPENTGRLNVSDGRMVPLRGARVSIINEKANSAPRAM